MPRTWRSMILFGTVCFLLINSSVEDVYEEDDDYRDLYIAMGTKTSYKFILEKRKRRQQTDDHRRSDEKSDLYRGGMLYASNPAADLPKFCRPVHVNVVLRHGTRFPSAKTGRVLRSFVDEFGDKITNPIYKVFRNWTPMYAGDQVKLLSGVGRKEMKGLGKRLFTKYRSLFETPDGGGDAEYDDIREIISYASSDLPRTQNSAKYFMKGMKEALYLPNDFNFNVAIESDSLRFYDRCTKFVDSVERNKTAFAEFKKYKFGDEMRSLALKVAERLGIDADLFLETDFGVTLWNMFVMCSTEASEIGRSLWCELFDDEDALILEYRSDLKHYYKWSHYPVSYMQSCPLLKDVMTNLDEAVIGSATNHVYKKAVLRFGHAETLNPFFTLLGLVNDSNIPRADNLKSIPDRLLKTSKNTPFSANIGVILHRCDSHDELHPKDIPKDARWPTKFEPYMVEFVHNERRLKLPFCDHDICPYTVMKKFYRDITINCQFESICDIKKPASEKDEL
ncbi:multiple inositol polyphosphate phosphatase 1-like [Tubulanus polymorphus]|uniref:multiple inositol polyphosphate phosphatase 1-like n=1 Tax=Tubulanus polymorphus TaxID=672921 RepID=UPI003DA548D3